MLSFIDCVQVIAGCVYENKSGSSGGSSGSKLCIYMLCLLRLVSFLLQRELLAMTRDSMH